MAFVETMQIKFRYDVVLETRGFLGISCENKTNLKILLNIYSLYFCYT
jgi:hypothetical protein